MFVEYELCSLSNNTNMQIILDMTEKALKGV